MGRYHRSGETLKCQKLNLVSSQHSQTREKSFFWALIFSSHLQQRKLRWQEGRACSCFNKDWVFSGVQRWARLTILMALLYPASFQCPLPQHILKNGCILIAQIHNLFVFYTGPWSLCAGLLFWLISFKLHSSSAYSKGKWILTTGISSSLLWLA